MNFLRTSLAGAGQFLTCSTSGIGFRLKWISIKICLVLSLSISSWTTISLTSLFNTAASSSAMSAYSWMAAVHCLALFTSWISSANFFFPSLIFACNESFSITGCFVCPASNLVLQWKSSGVFYVATAQNIVLKYSKSSQLTESYISNWNIFGTTSGSNIFKAIRYIAFAWTLSCQTKRLSTFLNDHSSL